MKNTLLALMLILFVGLSACETSTPLSTPEPGSAAPADTTSGPGSASASQATPTMGVSGMSETSTSQPPSAPSALRVVYIRDGNLWSWSEADGSAQLTGTGDMSTARLSDDGQLLAFMRGQDVWTVRMDGADARLRVSLEDEDAALWFAPDTSFLAISTRDHIEVVDLAAGKSRSVVTYPATPEGYYPEVVWSPDASGFKTVIPPQTETGQAELLFVFTDGTLASLAKFSMVPPSENPPSISPDGGYLIYVARLDKKNESLYLMDSSGATKPYSEPMENIHAIGWQPDSVHFAYDGENSSGAFMGSIDGSPTFIPVTLPPQLRWVDANFYLTIDQGSLILGGLNGARIPVDTGVQDFDFLP